VHRRLRGRAGALATAILAVSLVVLLAVEASGPPDVVSERAAERRLALEVRRAGTPLHEVRCVRKGELPRSFTCLAETSNDLHLALDVRIRADGKLLLRRP
jgi:hypothetical protein